MNGTSNKKTFEILSESFFYSRKKTHILLLLFTQKHVWKNCHMALLLTSMGWLLKSSNSKKLRYQSDYKDNIAVVFLL